MSDTPDTWSDHDMWRACRVLADTMRTVEMARAVIARRDEAMRRDPGLALAPDRERMDAHHMIAVHEPSMYVQIDRIAHAARRRMDRAGIV